MQLPDSCKPDSEENLVRSGGVCPLPLGGVDGWMGGWVKLLVNLLSNITLSMSPFSYHLLITSSADPGRRAYPFSLLGNETKARNPFQTSSIILNFPDRMRRPLVIYSEALTFILAIYTMH
jgi:hypothetical protein